MDYRERKLATARTAAAAMAQDNDLDAVYLAGSLTAGLGSPTSDVDVFAVSRTEERAGVTQLPTDGHRIDLEVYSTGWYERALAKLGAWDISRTDLRSKCLGNDELDVLVRLRQSEVVHDSPLFAGYRETLARHETTLRRMILSKWAVDANGHLSDLKGACADGDAESAAFIAQTLVAFAGKAVAAAAGDLYFGKKWVYCQLRRSAGETFPHRRFAYTQTGAWTQNGSVDELPQVLTFVQTMLVAAQTLGWHGTDVARWPFWTTGTGRYRRNPDFNAIHLTQGVLLNDELKSQFVVQPHVALVWGLCTGRDRDEVTSAAVALGGLIAADGAESLLNPQRIHRILDTLVERGLVVGAPGR